MPILPETGDVYGPSFFLRQRGLSLNCKRLTIKSNGLNSGTRIYVDGVLLGPVDKFEFLMDGSKEIVHARVTISKINGVEVSSEKISFDYPGKIRREK